MKRAWAVRRSYTGGPDMLVKQINEMLGANIIIDQDEYWVEGVSAIVSLQSEGDTDDVVIVFTVRPHTM